MTGDHQFIQIYLRFRGDSFTSYVEVGKRHFIPVAVHPYCTKGPWAGPTSLYMLYMECSLIKLPFQIFLIKFPIHWCKTMINAHQRQRKAWIKIITNEKHMAVKMQYRSKQIMMSYCTEKRLKVYLDKLHQCYKEPPMTVLHPSSRFVTLITCVHFRVVLINEAKQSKVKHENLPLQLW